MTEPIDDEQLDRNKKSLEIAKLSTEIKKIEAETKELNWRKISAWAPAISSIIIALITIVVTTMSGFLDGKSALVRAETLVLQVKKDSLSVIFHRDSLKMISEINKTAKQRDSLASKFIQDKIKFEKERIKLNQIISQSKNQIVGLITVKDSLTKNNNKLITCYSRANDFIMTYCIKDDGIPYQELFSSIPKPFYHRFSKSFDEIATMDISTMNYQQFLMEFVGYKIGSDQLIDKFIISEDKKKRIELSVIQGHGLRKGIEDLHKKLTGQFNCWKGLSKDERLELLKQSINRTR